MSAVRWVRGDQLSPAVRAECLARFVHRFTGEHRPAHVGAAMAKAGPQFRSDAEWLYLTRFAVTSSGRLDERVSHCEAHPIWPESPRLRRPLFDMIRALEIPYSNHESDLYVQNVAPVRVLLDYYPEAKRIASEFVNQAPPHEGERWWDIPFAFLPWWAERIEAGRRLERAKGGAA